jgi:hypothetical protein
MKYEPISKERQEIWNKNLSLVKNELSKDLPEYITKERIRKNKITEFSKTIVLD